jgi:GT2 family glycosyltransferase
MNLQTIEIISATRLSEREFWERSPLGISLRRIERDKRMVARIAYENKRGLPEVYNSYILAPNQDDTINDILLFIHDDVWIDDYFLVDRLIEGLKTYDIIGIAGNRRIVPNQPGWCFPDLSFVGDDRSNLVGSIAHGETPCGKVTVFGAFGRPTAECELLDGVFIAAKKSVLTNKGVLFDPRFKFDFYDLDFCRTARKNGLRLGTLPICLTHNSKGAFGTAKWQEMYHIYIDKWGS